MIASLRRRGTCDGHGSSGEAVVAGGGGEEDVGTSGGFGEYGREDGQDVSATRATAQRGRSAADMAYPARPVCRVLAEVFQQQPEAPGLEAKTLFEWLQQKYPGKFDDSQQRSFQRGVRRWRATAGPAQEVFCAQVHHPGRLAATMIRSRPTSHASAAACTSVSARRRMTRSTRRPADITRQRSGSRILVAQPILAKRTLDRHQVFLP